MFLNELENFEGYLNQLDRIMTKYAYYSEYEYICNNRKELAKEKTIVYTDMRNYSDHVIIEFDVLVNDPEYDDIWVKITDWCKM